jgi:hypothetical protein
LVESSRIVVGRVDLYRGNFGNPLTSYPFTFQAGAASRINLPPGNLNPLGRLDEMSFFRYSRPHFFHISVKLADKFYNHKSSSPH